MPIVALYIFIHKERIPELTERLQQLDDEHTSLTERILNLSASATGAIDKANAKIVRLESEMSDIRDQLHDLSCDLHSVLGELELRREAIARAKNAVTGDASDRRKAELLRSVIEKIVCYFVDTGGSGNQPRTRLESVEILPVVGDSSVTYLNGNTPARD